jgi:hypothetical protein
MNPVARSTWNWLSLTGGEYSGAYPQRESVRGEGPSIRRSETRRSEIAGVATGRPLTDSVGQLYRADVAAARGVAKGTLAKE